MILLFLFISLGICEYPMKDYDLNKYEARNAFRSTLEESESCSFTNVNVVSLAYGTKIVFTVNIPSDGIYPVALKFSNCTDNEFSLLNIYTNGHLQISKQQLKTSNWDYFYNNLNLRTGLNTIAYHLLEGDIAIDYIIVSGASQLSVRGATVSYVKYEAEDSSYQGTLLGPSKTYLQMPSEASNRMAIQFTKQGDHVEFTLSEPSNAAVVRYSIPDSPTGSGLFANLGVYIDGGFWQSINISSLYSWVYGSYPFTKNPSDGDGHHFYDDIRFMFGKVLPTGTKVRLQGLSPIEYVIDVVDFYSIPLPYTKPSGSLSVTDFGADPTGQRDSFNAFNAAINSAKNQGKSVWIPEGKFALSQRVTVDQMTIHGAGPWYSELHGHDIGIFGNWAPNPSSNVQLYDFAVFGQTRTRDDSEISSGVGGSLGGGSIVQNIWIEHDKCGMWLDGPFQGLLITGCTIRNTFADGINFHRGISNAIVEQTDIRNTGDDCLAMWAHNISSTYGPNTFRFNTLQLPILANTVAIYGGTGNSATDNLCLDTLNFGGGVQIGNRFDSIPLSGTTIAARNTLIRTGSTGLGQTVTFGAVWIYAGDSQMNSNVTISNIDISDSFSSAIQFFQNPITNVVFNNINIDTANYAVEERTLGSATFNYVVAKNLKIAGQWNCGVAFKVIEGEGNSGWNTVKCQ